MEKLLLAKFFFYFVISFFLKIDALKNLLVTLSTYFVEAYICEVMLMNVNRPVLLIDKH